MKTSNTPKTLYGMTFVPSDSDDTAEMLIGLAVEGWPDIAPTGSAIHTDVSQWVARAEYEKMSDFLDHCHMLAAFYVMDRELANAR